MIGDRAGDRLSCPPRGVGRKLIAATVLELLHRLHEAHGALLDQVEEAHAAVHVLLGDRDHEPEVGLDHLRLGLVGLANVELGLADDLLSSFALAPQAGSTEKSVRQNRMHRWNIAGLGLGRTPASSPKERRRLRAVEERFA